MKPITPCLWFDNQAEEAANFYISIFNNGRICGITRYGNEGREIHGKEAGSVLTVEFEIAGQRFTALNGGPIFKFNEAISLQVPCETQEEIDYYWEKLSQGGDPNAQQCGWLKDQFGVSWQVTPSVLGEWMKDPNARKTESLMKALLSMKKLDLEGLRHAYNNPA